MIRLSMNVMSASLSLIRIIDSEKGIPFWEIHSLYRVSDIDVDDLIEMLSICKIVIKQEESLLLSESGKRIIKSVNENYEKCIRLFLCEYIFHTEPIWSKRIPYGRCEASTFMTKDERSCFYEAGLLSDELDYEIVLWWDELSEIIRKQKDAAKNTTGRSGEQCTIAFEKERVGKKPIWKSIDSNLMGYDIMSISSVEDKSPFLIEVKASIEDMQHAYFHISSNEWQVANHALNYAFYLWNLHTDKKFLAIVYPYEMNLHMPENRKSGEWESVKIPFSCFEEKFFEWGTSI